MGQIAHSERGVAERNSRPRWPCQSGLCKRVAAGVLVVHVSSFALEPPSGSLSTSLRVEASRTPRTACQLPTYRLESWRVSPYISFPRSVRCGRPVSKRLVKDPGKKDPSRRRHRVRAGHARSDEAWADDYQTTRSTRRAGAAGGQRHQDSWAWLCGLETAPPAHCAPAERRTPLQRSRHVSRPLQSRQVPPGKSHVPQRASEGRTNKQFTSDACLGSNRRHSPRAGLPELSGSPRRRPRRIPRSSHGYRLGRTLVRSRHDDDLGALARAAAGSEKRK